MEDIDRVRLIELRQQAHFWQAQHARAVQREAALKAEVRQLQATVGQLHAQIGELRRQRAQQEEQITEKDQQIEALKAKVVEFARQVFGRRTEKTGDGTSADHEPGQESTDGGSGDTSSADHPQPPADGRRRRGQQPGAAGHGRQRHLKLPCIEEVCDLPEAERRCPRCGKRFNDFPGTEDSEEIEWEVILRRRVYKRKRYHPTCDCPENPGIVTAPVPAKLIPKGMFATSFWVRLLLEKYLFQRPLLRIVKVLSLEGLDVSPGTLTGGLKRLGELFQPIYTRILERSRAADRWKMDETRWTVFEEVDGKVGHRWWLWVIITCDTVVYLLEPTRSATVPKNHLGPDPEGIINADRYAVYTSLGDKVQVAFCWSHLRRDFIRVGEGYRSLAGWSQAWVTRINEIFHLNRERLKVRSDPHAFDVADQALREAVKAMAHETDRQLADPRLHRAARKVLQSMRERWSGYTIFVDHPEIPPDNNESERRLRDPAVGRKNYYGSGSQWSAMLTAMLFTIFQTLLKNQIDPQKWLFGYFQACAENGGRASEDLDAWLPWNLPAEKKAAWHYPERPP
jgi:transposase